MNKDLERAVRQARTAQKEKAQAMQEFERDRGPATGRVSQNVRIEKEALQQKAKAKQAFNQ